MNVGFIGLGIMGSGMAHNLLAHEVSLIVCNRTVSKVEPLIAAGADWAAKPRDVAPAELVFTMLAHPAAVRSVALGPDGFLDHLAPESLWVDCSTVHPRFSREMAAEAAARHIRFIDAPVAGTKPQAEGGQLVFLVGAEEDDLERCRPYMEMMGRSIVHVGGQGMGSSLKVVVNSLLAASMASFAENVALGQSLGLSRDQLFNILIGGPVTAPFLAGKREMMETDNYDPQFPLQWMHKDLQMALEAAADTGASLPLTAATRDIYQAAQDEGLQELDFSAIYHYYNRQQS